MKNIYRIFRNDLKTIARNMISLIVIIGISILPALYSWFNIAANWDPYSNTGGIAFAVCSEDKGYNYTIGVVNAGNQIVDNLKKNDKMGWDFVSKKDALDGVKNGKYYASIIIPEDFSENLCSIITGKFKQAEIKYYVNEKKNAIAPKMTNAGVTTIQNEIKSTYVSTITRVIATTLNLTTSVMSNTKDTTSEKITDALDELSKQLDTFGSGVDVFSSTIDGLKDSVETNRKLLPEMEDSLAKAGVITVDINSAADSAKKAAKTTADTVGDMIGSASDTISSVDETVQEIFSRLKDDAGSTADELDTLADSSSKISSVSDKLTAFLQRLDGTYGVDKNKVISTLGKLSENQKALSDKLKTAADKLRSAGSVPEELQTEITTLIAAIKTDIDTAKSSFDEIKNGINSIFDDITRTGDKISAELKEAADKLAEDTKNAADKLRSAAALGTQIVSLADQAITDLSAISDSYDIDVSSLTAVLSTLSTDVQQLVDKVNDAANTIEKTGKLPQDIQKEISDLKTRIEGELSGLGGPFGLIKTSLADIGKQLQNINDDIIPKLEAVLNALSGNAEGAAQQLESLAASSLNAATLLDTVSEFLNNTKTSFTVDTSSAVSLINSFNSSQKQLSSRLAAAADEIRKFGDISVDLQSDSKKLLSGMKSNMDKLTASYNDLKTKITRAANDVFEVIGSASDYLQKAGEGIDLDSSFDDAEGVLDNIKTTFDNIKTLITKFKTSVDDLKVKLTQLTGSNAITGFVTTIIERPDALGNFVGNPVTVDTNSIYPVENYGSGMAPFYTTLGFWVGSVVLVAILRTEPKKKELRRLKSPNSTQLYFGRLLIFLVIGTIQSLIISLGDVFFLKIQCENIPLFIASAVISGLVYVLITYSLTITFSVVGKALSVIILVIQVAGSGGTFPVEVLPDGFRAMAPYLPFKYSINMMREAVAGVDWNSYFINLLCLLAFVPVFLILGLLLRKPCIKLMSFFNNRLDESDLIV